MATILWPTTLPGPSAANFKCGVKPHGIVTRFASGRSRVFRNRATPYELLNGFEGELQLTASLTFQFTIPEYETFIEFYTTYWKTFANQSANVLYIPSQGMTIYGWVPGDISTVRNGNSWEVSFDVQSKFYNATDGDVPDWNHPVAPELPDVFKMTSGTKIERVSRDVTISEPEFNLQRSIVTGEKFAIVSVDWQLFDFAHVNLLFGWYAMSTKFGAKPFKVPSENLPIGPIGGASPTFGYYGCKFLAPPNITFRGAFGTASAQLLVFVPIESAISTWTISEILSFDNLSADLTILDSQNILTTNVEIYESKGVSSWEV